MIMRRVLTSACLAGSLAISAAAQDRSDAIGSVGYSVFMYSLGYADSILTPDQQATMELIAYQTTVGRVCTDYTIDTTRLSQAVTELDHVNAEDLSAEEAAYAERLAMMSLGIAMGGLLAEFTLDPDGFCGTVDAFISEAGEESLIAAR